MPRKRKCKNNTPTLPVLNANAAGLDIGATEIYVAVPADRDAESVRCFATFTQDLGAFVKGERKPFPALFDLSEPLRDARFGHAVKHGRECRMVERKLCVDLRHFLVDLDLCISLARVTWLLLK